MVIINNFYTSVGSDLDYDNLILAFGINKYEQLGIIHFENQLDLGEPYVIFTDSTTSSKNDNHKKGVALNEFVSFVNKLNDEIKLKINWNYKLFDLDVVNGIETKTKNKIGSEVVNTVVNDPDRLIIWDKFRTSFQLFSSKEKLGLLYIKKGEDTSFRGFRESIIMKDNKVFYTSVGSDLDYDNLILAFGINKYEQLGIIHFENQLDLGEPYVIFTDSTTSSKNDNHKKGVALNEFVSFVNRLENVIKNERLSHL